MLPETFLLLFVCLRFLSSLRRWRKRGTRCGRKRGYPCKSTDSSRLWLSILHSLPKPKTDAPLNRWDIPLYWPGVLICSVFRLSVSLGRLMLCLQFLLQRNQWQHSPPTWEMASNTSMTSSLCASFWIFTLDCRRIFTITPRLCCDKPQSSNC